MPVSDIDASDRAVQRHEVRYSSLGPLFKLRGMAGVRAFGWQFDITDHRVMPPLFSERYGYGTDRYHHVGPFCLRVGRLRRVGDA